MFGHIFCSQLKKGFRSKMNIGWTLLFPIVLGTLFYVCFGEIYKSDVIDTIPAAVVTEKLSDSERKQLETIIDAIELENGRKLIVPVYTSVKEADTLLKEEKVIGIITADSIERLTLQVGGQGIEESILGSFISQYAQTIQLIREVSANHPEKLEQAVLAFSERFSFIAGEKISEGNKDPYVQYFYNLIAMVCLFASMAGIMIPIDSQANLSDVGARINIAPVSKLKLELAAFLAQFLVQIIIVYIALVYLLAVLQINFGGDILLIFLTASVGTFFGMTIGFLIGHIGTAGVNTKTNILTAVSMAGCFLSGLMVANMKIIIQEHCPIVNKINPAAVISDAFYALNIYGVGQRFYLDIVIIAAESIIFLMIGIILARRTRYESI